MFMNCLSCKGYAVKCQKSYDSLSNDVIIVEICIFVQHMSRKEGQHTQEELQKRNLRDELEERERKHYSSKDKSYAGTNFGSLCIILLPLLFIDCSPNYLYIFL
jgi:hypothetical protein